MVINIGSKIVALALALMLGFFFGKAVVVVPCFGSCPNDILLVNSVFFAVVFGAVAFVTLVLLEKKK